MTHTTFSNFGRKYANHFRSRSCLTTFNKLRLFEHVTYPTGDLLKSEWNRVEQRRKKRLDTSFFAHCPTVCQYVLPLLVAPKNWFSSIINVRPGILKYLIYVVYLYYTFVCAQACDAVCVHRRCIGYVSNCCFCCCCPPANRSPSQSVSVIKAANCWSTPITISHSVTDTSSTKNMNTTQLSQIFLSVRSTFSYSCNKRAQMSLKSSPTADDPLQTPPHNSGNLSEVSPVGMGISAPYFHFYISPFDAIKLLIICS